MQDDIQVRGTGMKGGPIWLSLIGQGGAHAMTRLTPAEARDLAKQLSAMADTHSGDYGAPLVDGTGITGTMIDTVRGRSVPVTQNPDYGVRAVSEKTSPLCPCGSAWEICRKTFPDAACAVNSKEAFAAQNPAYVAPTGSAYRAPDPRNK